MKALRSCPCDSHMTCSPPASWYTAVSALALTALYGRAVLTEDSFTPGGGIESSVVKGGLNHGANATGSPENPWS